MIWGCVLIFMAGFHLAAAVADMVLGDRREALVSFLWFLFSGVLGVASLVSHV